MDIEHIVPESDGGTTDEANLWLACSLCNSYKGNRTSFQDPISGREVSLFNPRQQKWGEHFAWEESGSKIVGLTANWTGHGGRFGPQPTSVGEGAQEVGSHRLAPSQRRIENQSCFP